MTNTTPHGQVPEALRLAHIFDSPLPPEWPDMVAAAAELRRQHARIAELEAVGAGGVQALSAAPAGWKLVPVNPTPEMWKAAKSVPDPNPPYPPHYGLVWDAMLAASPTPPAEQPAPNTGHAEADRLIGRLMSSDPDFEDCWHAAALIQREIKGPDGFGTWREAAIAERLARVNQQAATEAALGGVYAELPAPLLIQYDEIDCEEFGCFSEGQMRDFADRTHALRQQAAPKAAPGELHDHQILAITTAYEQGVGKGRQAHESGKEFANPYDTGYRCDLAWQYGYEEGKKQAERIAEAASKQEAQEPALWMNEKGHTWSYSDWKQFPKHRAKYPIPLYPHFPATQPAPAPLSEQIDKLERKLAIIAVVGVIDGHDVVRRESVLEIARRAALAAQGGRDAG